MVHTIYILVGFSSRIPAGPNKDMAGFQLAREHGKKCYWSFWVRLSDPFGDDEWEDWLGEPGAPGVYVGQCWGPFTKTRLPDHKQYLQPGCEERSYLLVWENARILKGSAKRKEHEAEVQWYFKNLSTLDEAVEETTRYLAAKQYGRPKLELRGTELLKAFGKL